MPGYSPHPDAKRQARINAHLAASKRRRKRPAKLSQDVIVARSRYTVDSVGGFIPIDAEAGMPLAQWPNGPRPPRGWEGYYRVDVTTPAEMHEWLACEVDTLQQMDNDRLPNDNPGQSVRNASRLAIKLGVIVPPALLARSQEVSPVEEIARLRVVQDLLSPVAPAVEVVPVHGFAGDHGELHLTPYDRMPGPVRASKSKNDTESDNKKKSKRPPRDLKKIETTKKKMNKLLEKGLTANDAAAEISEQTGERQTTILRRWYRLRRDSEPHKK